MHLFLPLRHRAVSASFARPHLKIGVGYSLCVLVFHMAPLGFFVSADDVLYVCLNHYLIGLLLR